MIMLLFMADHLIDEDGRRNIAEVVRAVMAWQGLSGAQVAAKPGRPEIATIYRIQRADPKVSDVMLRAMGGKLGLPMDFLLYVGTRDIAKIRASGADEDVIRWTIDLIEGDEKSNRA